tara:strand:- start:1183 stop:1296 length:114 start_codon:yes stop_codon:yes gene_type:complete
MSLASYAFSLVELHEGRKEEEKKEEHEFGQNKEERKG